MDFRFKNKEMISAFETGAVIPALAARSENTKGEANLNIRSTAGFETNFTGEQSRKGLCESLESLPPTC